MEERKIVFKEEKGIEIMKGVLSVFLLDAVRDTFLIDPAVILIVVGVVMFFITFCGCIGALRENIRLLKTVIDIADTLLILVLCVASDMIAQIIFNPKPCLKSHV